MKTLRLAFLCLFVLTLAAACANKNRYGLSPTAETLIPKSAERVAVSEGNLTLRSNMTLDQLTAFYDGATRRLDAKGRPQTNLSYPSGSAQPVWDWLGTMPAGGQLRITIYPFDLDQYTIVATY